MLVIDSAIACLVGLKQRIIREELERDHIVVLSWGGMSSVSTKNVFSSPVYHIRGSSDETRSLSLKERIAY